MDIIIIIKNMIRAIKLAILIFIVFIISPRYFVVFSNEKQIKDEIINAYLDKIEKEGYIIVDVLQAKDIPNRGWDIKDYRIEKDDVLEISVWQAEELKRSVVVRPDGKISFPLIGDVEAEGKSVEDVRRVIKEKISKYVRNPQVSVIIKEFGGKRATVLKETEGGGVIRFTSPITIIEALAMAGGYNTDLNLKKVFVIRPPQKEGGHVKIIVVNVQNILRKGDIRENIYLRSDDIIFLPRGGFATVKYVKNELLSLINMSFKYTPSTGSRWTKFSMTIPDTD